jgi:hypothetical protein
MFENLFRLFTTFDQMIVFKVLGILVLYQRFGRMEFEKICNSYCKDKGSE